MLFDAAASLSQFGINLILKLDSQREFLLSKLNRRPLLIKFTDFNEKILLQPTEISLIVTRGQSEVSQTDCVCGTLTSFIEMIKSDDPKTLIHEQKIMFYGDLQSLLNYQDFFFSLQPDITFFMRRHLPLEMAYLLQRPASKLFAKFKHHIQTMPRNIRDYLQEEGQWLAPRMAQQDSFDDIRKTKQAVDRVAAKFQQLLQEPVT